MKSLVTRFVKDESGATAIEYGLIAGLVSVVIIAVLGLLGTELDDVVRIRSLNRALSKPSPNKSFYGTEAETPKGVPLRCREVPSLQQLAKCRQ